VVAPLTEARRAGEVLPAVRIAGSDDLGWRHALARTYRDDRHTPAFATHPTDDLLLVVVRSGGGVLEVRRGRRWESALYRTGSVGATAPGTSSTLRWETTSAEPMVSSHVHLAAHLLAETSDALGTAHRAPDALELDDPFVREALLLLARGAEDRAESLYADSIAQALAAHVLSGPRREQAPRGRGLSAAALRSVDAWMRAHLADDVGLDDLAAVVHLSKHHFLRQFRAATGTTPHRELTRLRMERAAELLRAGRAPGAVAAQVGYRSPSRFAERFRQAHGVTPGVFQSSATR
jgi:AraC family transcriptional regulator